MSPTARWCSARLWCSRCGAAVRCLPSDWLKPAVARFDLGRAFEPSRSAAVTGCAHEVRADAVAAAGGTRVADYVTLAKPRLNLLVVASTMVGYVMGGGRHVGRAAAAADVRRHGAGRQWRIGVQSGLRTRRGRPDAPHAAAPNGGRAAEPARGADVRDRDLDRGPRAARDGRQRPRRLRRGGHPDQLRSRLHTAETCDVVLPP